MKNARCKIAPGALVLAPLAGVALALGLRRSSANAGFWARTLGIAPWLIRLWRTWVSPANQSK